MYHIGDPYTRMGLLSVYNHQYGVLQSRNFVIGPGMNPLAQLYSQPYKAIETPALTNAVKLQVAEKQTRFQVRLQFSKVPGYSPAYGHTLDFFELLKGKSKLVVFYK
jgi:hypothetical protein